MALTKAVFKGVNEDTVTLMAKKQSLINIAKDEKKPKKAEIVKVIASEIEDAGIKQLSSLLSKVQLAEVCNPIVDESTSQSKVFLKKRLAEKMREMGVKSFLEEHMSVPMLKTLIEASGVTTKTSQKDDLVRQLSDLIELIGTEVFLSRYDVTILKSMMDDKKLTYTTSSKSSIIESLTANTHAKADPSKKRPDFIEFSKKKKAIQVGVTYQDIFQHYFLKELQDFCRENELSPYGKKSDVIKRILDHLEQNKENSKKVVEKKKEKESKSKEAKKVEQEKEKEKEKEDSESEEEEEVVEKVVEKEVETEKSPKTAKAPKRVSKGNK